MERYATPELCKGDVVHEYGMRIRLDREPKTWDGGNGETVYAWNGLVENLPEVLDAGLVPASFLSEEIWDAGWKTRLNGRWTVQGNRLASYYAERGNTDTLVCEYSATHKVSGVPADVWMDCGAVGKVPACGDCRELYARLSR